MRALLEAAAAELEAQREDVLSSTLIWPRALDAERCAAFLHAVDHELAVLETAGYVSVPSAGRFPCWPSPASGSASTSPASPRSPPSPLAELVRRARGSR